MSICGRIGMMMIAAIGLCGCAKFSSDGGMSAVTDIAAHDLKKDALAIRDAEEAERARATVQRLLLRPLTADAAVQVALLNNRGLQAAYNDLAVAEAQMVEQSLPPNPTFSLMRIGGSAEIEIERRIIADILALATLPARSEIAQQRFNQAQLFAALETLRVGATARRAYYRAVAARELVDILRQAQSAADTASQLAVRLGQTGAMNKLDQAREHVFYAEITAQLASEQQIASSEREALVRSLGLWGHDLGFRLPSSLPPAPHRARNLASIETEAVRRRVDLQIARIELDALAKSLGLTQATRFINLLDAGYADKLTTDREAGRRIRERGFDVELQIPLFDFGEVRVRQAEAIYMQAVNQLFEKAVNVRSEARDAYRVYRSTYDIAGHYQREVLPLRKIISDEMILRYGAMQVDVFSLLAEARQRLNASITAVQAKRDFWIADSDLLAAVVGGGRGSRDETSRPMAGTGGESGSPRHE
jgi:outer membrane protein TolC